MIDIAEANALLAEFTSNLSDESMAIHNSKPCALQFGALRLIAALFNLENIDLETISLSTNPKFIEMIERSRARRRVEGGISSQEMRRRLGLNEV